MLNQVILVGRIADIPKSNTENNKKVSIVIAVPRPFKNIEGIYETDIIKCNLWNNLASNTIEYCRKGDLVGIKGRVQSNKNESDIIAEKITFLAESKDK